MARLQNNIQTLIINGQEITTEFISAGITKNNQSVETTSGSGIEDVMRGRGLNSYTFRASIAYMTETVDDILAAIGEDDVVEIEFGDQGNAVGKPRHVGLFNITSIEHSGKTATKEAVEFTIQAESAGAPTVNMFDGGVYTAP